MIQILELFNRKERFFLVAEALGLRSCSGEPAFSLSDCFRKQLNAKIKVEIPLEPEMVFVAMDYHLDWLQAALTLAHTSQDEKSKFCNEGKVTFCNVWNVWNACNEGKAIEGTQKGVDLLVAFKVGETPHLILVEAKAYSGWTNPQLSSKAKRLRMIFGEGGKKWPSVQPCFYAIGPKESAGLSTQCLPEWMLDEGGQLQWLSLSLPKQ